MSPKVSICIPSYNHARFLPAALNSALGQTYREFEIIIVDDGSADDSLSIAESYAAKYPALIRVFTHPGRRNLGISATANLAHQKSTGEYWAGLCSDDVWYPDKLERQVALLERQPRIGLVYGLAHVIAERGQPLRTMGDDISHQPSPVDYLLQWNAIPAATVMVRRKCFEQVGLEDGALFLSDWELWLRILAHWRAGFINRPLMQYRVHTYNTSLGLELPVRLQHMLEMLTALQQKAGRVGGALARPRTLALLHLQRAYLLFCLADEAAAAQSLAAAFAADLTLARDVNYIVGWLQARLYDSYGQGHHTPERSFALWTLRHLPATVNPLLVQQLTPRITGLQYAQAALKYRNNDRRKSRQMAVRCLLQDPRWLGERALLSTLAVSIFGEELLAPLRLLKRRLSNS